MEGDESRRDSFRGALLGVAIGDGLGAPFEGAPGPVTPDEIAAVERSTSMLRHTDDTAMTIALAEGQFGGQGSFGNGAAMRAAPVALHAGDDHALVRAARASATVTHTHPLAVEATTVQVRAVAALLGLPEGTGVDAGNLVARLRATVHERELDEQLGRVVALSTTGDAARIARELGTGIAAVEAVPAALCAFLSHPDSFADAVRFAIHLGGDTDTVAAMAGALAGARHGERGIPGEWVERTEAGDVLRALADDLAGF